MATIQRRSKKDGTITYRVGYYDENRKFRFTPTLANEAGAKKIKRIIEDPRKGVAVALQLLDAAQDSDGLTLAEFFPRFLESRRLRCTDGTIAGYRREAERTFMPRLGDFPLAEIDRDMVRDWILWQSQQPTARSERLIRKHEEAGLPLPPVETVSPKTVKNAHSLLSSVLAYAVQDGKVPANHAHGADLPAESIEEEKAIFTRTEWSRFYEAMTEHYQPFILTMLATGARWGELTALQVQDVDLHSGTVHIRRAFKKAEKGRVLGVPKSPRSRRVILLADWAVAALAPLVQDRPADALVFTSPEGNVIHRGNFVNRHWTPALHRAKIGKHLTPHSLRHTFASWALMAGVPPQTVQHRLGHESLQTTSKVYAHLLLEEQSRAVDAIGWTPPKQLQS